MKYYMRNSRDYNGCMVVSDQKQGDGVDMGQWPLYLQWECQKNERGEVGMVRHGEEWPCAYLDQETVTMGLVARVNFPGQHSQPPVHDVDHDLHTEVQIGD